MTHRPRSVDPDAVEEHFTERNGFLTGKSAAIAEWRHRKERKAFDVVVNRLRVRKYEREARANGGPALEKLRARALRYSRKPEVVAKQTARQKALRRARAKQSPRVFICDMEDCRAQWCRVVLPGKRLPSGPAPRFCSEACAQIHRYRQKAETAARTVTRRCTGCGKPGHNIRRCPEPERAVAA